MSSTFTFFFPLFLPGRYELAFLVPLFWFAGAAVDANASLLLRWVGRTLVGASWLAFFLAGKAFVEQPESHRFRRALLPIVEEQTAADVVAVGFVYAPLAVAAYDLGASLRVRAFPSAIERSPGERPVEGFAPADLERDAMALLAIGSPRLHVLFTARDAPWVLVLEKTFLQHGYEKTQSTTTQDLAHLVLSKRSSE